MTTGRSRSFLLATISFCALAMLSITARAEDAPPAPPGPAAHQPAPAPAPAPAPGAETPAPVARKEEDETAGMLARIAAFAKSKTGLADQIAALQRQNTAQAAALKEKDERIKTLEAELHDRTELLTKFGAWLEENGHTTAKEAAADPGKAFQNAVGNGIARETRRIGIPVSTIQTKTAPSGDATTLAEVEELLAAAKTPADRQAILSKYSQLILAAN